MPLPARPETALRYIAARKRRFVRLSDRFRFWHELSPEQRLEALQEGRRLINEIKSSIVAYSNSDAFYHDFETDYNEVRRHLTRFVEVPPLTRNLARSELDNIKADMVERVSLFSNWAEKSLEQKAAYFDEIFENVDNSILNGFRPQQVVFSIPDTAEHLLDGEKLKGFIADYHRNRRRIQSTINSAITNGYPQSRAFAELMPAVEQMYPTGTIPIPVRHTKEILDDAGNVIDVVDIWGTRSMNTGEYASNWIRDMRGISHSKSQVAAALGAGFDVVKVVGGKHCSECGANCPICGQYHNQKFSLTGRESEYTKIENFPPFHPWCDHRLRIVVYAKKEGASDAA